MKVGILTTSHSTFDTRIFHKEARTLADAGYDVTLVTPHEQDVERDEITIRAVGQKDVESAGLNHAREIYKIAKLLDADVYHFHDPGFLPFGLLLSYNTAAKVVYDCHEDYGRAFKYYDSVPLKPVTSRLFPHVQSAIAKRFDAIVAATDWIAEDFRERGHSNVALVRNFPRISMAGECTATVDDDHDHTMVYVGNLSEERGLSDMLKLTAKLRDRGLDTALWLLGRLNDSAESVVKSFVMEEELQNHVRTFGYVQPDEIFQYLRAADIGLCLLSGGRAEYIIPTKIFEYMLSGLPVVATETTATRRYVSDEYGRLVDENIEKQADVVQYILSDPDLRNHMGQAGRGAVSDCYSWEAEEGTLLSLYDRLG